MKRNTIVALTVVGGLLLHAKASATVWYVNADIPTPGTGMTPATAFNEIQDIAPPTLQPGDEIRIAGGTTTAYQATVTAYSGVKIYGGFSPNGDSAFAIRNPELYPTVIDASSSNVGLEVVGDALPSTEIDGLTIENAGVFGIVNGAGSQAFFRHLILKDNGGNSSASGAFQNGIDYAFARVESCVFENNIGTNGGGAFRNPHNSSFLIERCTFRGNQALFGGAVYNTGL